MRRFPIGARVRVIGQYFAGRTGVILAEDWRTENAPDYQRVRLDHGDEHLLRIDRLEVVEKTGQQDLFGGVG